MITRAAKQFDNAAQQAEARATSAVMAALSQQEERLSKLQGLFTRRVAPQLREAARLRASSGGAASSSSSRCEQACQTDGAPPRGPGDIGGFASRQSSISHGSDRSRTQSPPPAAAEADSFGRATASAKPGSSAASSSKAPSKGTSRRASLEELAGKKAMHEASAAAKEGGGGDGAVGGTVDHGDASNGDVDRRAGVVGGGSEAPAPSASPISFSPPSLSPPLTPNAAALAERKRKGAAGIGIDATAAGGGGSSAGSSVTKRSAAPSPPPAPAERSEAEWTALRRKLKAKRAEHSRDKLLLRAMIVAMTSAKETAEKRARAAEAELSVARTQLEQAGSHQLSAPEKFLPSRVSHPAPAKRGGHGESADESGALAAPVAAQRRAELDVSDHPAPTAPPPPAPAAAHSRKRPAAPSAVPPPEPMRPPADAPPLVPPLAPPGPAPPQPPRQQPQQPQQPQPDQPLAAVRAARAAPENAPLAASMLPLIAAPAGANVLRREPVRSAAAAGCRHLTRDVGRGAARRRR